jgi:hypothetical protein
MLKLQKRHFLALALVMVLATTAPAQMLRGDKAFPILNELNWNMNMQDVQNLCQKRGVSESAKDSLVILTVSFFGSSTRTEIQFDQDLKKIKRVQVKFKEATKVLADTLVQHLTAICGTPPYRTTKEKNFLIVTLRIQMAIWRSPTEIVNLVSGLKGEDIMDLSLALVPPTKQQLKSEK